MSLSSRVCNYGCSSPLPTTPRYCECNLSPWFVPPPSIRAGESLTRDRTQSNDRFLGFCFPPGWKIPLKIVLHLLSDPPISKLVLFVAIGVPIAVTVTCFFFFSRCASLASGRFGRDFASCPFPSYFSPRPIPRVFETLGKLSCFFSRCNFQSVPFPKLGYVDSFVMCGYWVELRCLPRPQFTFFFSKLAFLGLLPHKNTVEQPLEKADISIFPRVSAPNISFLAFAFAPT